MVGLHLRTVAMNDPLSSSADLRLHCMHHRYLRIVPLTSLKTDSIRAVALYAAYNEYMKLCPKFGVSTFAVGEEPNVGLEQDNYLAFEAHLDATSGGGSTIGSLVVYWPNAPGGRAGCSSNTSWPLLDTITLLGVPTADPDSVTVLVITYKQLSQTLLGVS